MIVVLKGISLEFDSGISKYSIFESRQFQPISAKFSDLDSHCSPQSAASDLEMLNKQFNSHFPLTEDFPSWNCTEPKNMAWFRILPYVWHLTIAKSILVAIDFFAPRSVSIYSFVFVLVIHTIQTRTMMLSSNISPRHFTITAISV